MRKRDAVRRESVFQGALLLLLLKLVLEVDACGADTAAERIPLRSGYGAERNWTTFSCAITMMNVEQSPSPACCYPTTTVVLPLLTRLSRRPLVHRVGKRLDRTYARALNGAARRRHLLAVALQLAHAEAGGGKT